MPAPGYYRYPAIFGGTIVFVSEDDLWAAPAEGGPARRLTANLGPVSHPYFSRDGALLAFTGREEGPAEVYIMPAEGGAVRRVTYLGANSIVMGWTPDSGRVLFSSDAGQPFERLGMVYAVGTEGGLPERLPVGPAVSVSVAAGNRTVIGRNNEDIARWKRYRGGRTGDIWVDADGQGEFRRLLQLEGNVARPMWVGERIFFVSDHEGVGNLYSCLPSGKDLRRHTHRTDFFVRHPSTDGARVVYHAGADLYLYDPRTDKDRRVPVEYASPRVHRQRRFVDAAKYLESYAPHPEGHSLALTSRGKSFTMGNWEGAVSQQGATPAPADPARYRLTRWLNDGRRVVTVVDVGGVESLEVHDAGSAEGPVRLEEFDIGRAYAIRVSPTADELLLSNHRNELVFVDLAARSMQVVDRSRFGHIQGLSWSPDGRWAAYGFSASEYTTEIRLWDRASNQIHAATKPVLRDRQPAFDPDGKYLYFIGQRDLNPVYDNLHFDLGFPRGERPYLITLRADLPSPFLPTPRRFKDPAEELAEAQARQAQGTPEVVIDLDGIERRVVPFPVPEGKYGQIVGIDRKALFTSLPVEGALGADFTSTEPPSNATLEVYDFKEQKHEPLVPGVTDFQVSRDGKTLVYRAGQRLRVVRAGAKPGEKQNGDPAGKPGGKPGETPGRESGWVDLGRVKVAVDPGTEWRQMAREAWRLQQEYFWTEDMSHVDWKAVWDRYRPLVDRVGTRGEFSDLMWEMQGELGTSHAYELGGDYREAPSYPQGLLGADVAYDEDAGAYAIARVVRGTAGDPEADSPLNGPGVNARAGDRIRAINGCPVTREVIPQQLLVHQAGSEVALTLERPGGETRTVTVRAAKSEYPARYREWVEANRRTVHEATGGRAGYVHVPDMGPRGYAEFHRSFLAEADRDALLVDVRFNRGGHVSQLLIEKLARKRVGYGVARWGEPSPYPEYSVAGPLVALTNEWAGSDGDIFSHVFKLMKLGPLVGKRTWGGVIGIWPRNQLADGSITTQPEFSFWFQDVAWGVENYGTDPDIEVDITPQDYGRGRDPQLERAIAVLLERLEKEPPVRPTFGDRPNLAAPVLIVGGGSPE
jgi:tricorn protease